MLVASRVSGAFVAVVVAILTGCAGSHEHRCSDPVLAGEYTLAMRPLLDGPHYGMRFELGADGTFAGHLGEEFPGAPARCDGIFGPEESEQLTAAINRGEFFCRGNTYDDTVHDVSYLDIEVRTVDGLRSNRFCGHSVPDDTALDALTQAPFVALVRVRESGGCMGEPYEVPTRTEWCPPATPAP